MQPVEPDLAEEPANDGPPVVAQADGERLAFEGAETTAIIDAQSGGDRTLGFAKRPLNCNPRRAA